MRWHRAVVLSLVLLAVLELGADAKKKHKKKPRVPRAERAAPPVLSPPSALPQPQPDQQPAAQQEVTPATVVTAEVKAAFDGQKAQLNSQHAENVRLVDSHNKLAQQYNKLLADHSDLVKRYNLLVTELMDPSLPSFLTAKAMKMGQHPGIQGAVNKTQIHVVPFAQKTAFQAQQISGAWVNKTQANVMKFLQQYGPDDSEHWAPSASGAIVYGSVLCPLSVACWCVLEFVCKLNTLLLFGHIYMSVTCSCLAVFALITGDDPLTTFAEQDSKLYQFAQCGFALVFVAYGVVSMCAMCCGGRSNSNTMVRLSHVFFVVLFGACYYGLVWTPAMVDELPKVDDFMETLVPQSQTASDEQTPLLTTAPYMFNAILFSMLFLFDKGETSEAKTDDDEGEKEK